MINPQAAVVMRIIRKLDQRGVIAGVVTIKRNAGNTTLPYGLEFIAEVAVSEVQTVHVESQYSIDEVSRGEFALEPASKPDTFTISPSR